MAEEEVEMTPISMDEVGDVPPKVSPFSAAPAAAKPEAEKPQAPAAPAASAKPATVKLKPVIRKPSIHRPTIGGTPKPPAAPAPAAKKATQNLKSVTGPIPIAASLKKTGIIAEGIITPAQQQASKSKTSRISLESAIGVAPVNNGPAPLKTIRLRRPADLKPNAPASMPISQPAQPAPAPAPAPAPEPVQAQKPPAAEPVAELSQPSDAEVTQKKTLKLHRPGAPISRPSMGVGASASAADAGAAPAPTPASTLNPFPMSMDAPAKGGSDVPTWLSALSLITAVAALVVIGLVTYYLWTEGVGPQASANEMQFLSM